MKSFDRPDVEGGNMELQEERLVENKLDQEREALVDQQIQKVRDALNITASMAKEMKSNAQYFFIAPMKRILTGRGGRKAQEAEENRLSEAYDVVSNFCKLTGVPDPFLQPNDNAMLEAINQTINLCIERLDNPDTRTKLRKAVIEQGGNLQ